MQDIITVVQQQMIAVFEWRFSMAIHMTAASGEASEHLVQTLFLWLIELDLQCLEVYSTCGFW